MNTRTSRWTTDLLVVLASTVLATGAVLFDVGASLTRTVLVAPLVVFLPGYALVSALFPESYDGGVDDRGAVAAPGTVGTSISVAGRVGLSAAASIALLPAVVTTSGFVYGRFQVALSLYVVAAVTVVLTLVALLRRGSCPPGERFGVPTTGTLFESIARPFRVREKTLSEGPTFQPESWGGLLLNVALGASVLLLLSTVVVGYAYPTQEEQFTELYIVTETGDGEFVAADFPAEFEAGESRPVYATVSNHEGDRQSYTLVATLQRVEQSGDGTRVTQEAELTRVSRTLQDGETARIRHDLQPSFGGDRLRVQYLLYLGDPPADPSAENAYRTAHVWISADGGSGSVTADSSTTGPSASAYDSPSLVSTGGA
ncbi:DUF1616 domain-containing protein [Haloarchaeobius sp. HRN-SO-5]|uniref:DUF1616 domain-containing protein n=1 Tax=Haloarchaeobius sp. HRN-SO-5 TaxID=3446118 RepID=UPI003EC01291